MLFRSVFVKLSLKKNQGPGAASALGPWLFLFMGNETSRRLLPGSSPCLSAEDSRGPVGPRLSLYGSKSTAEGCSWVPPKAKGDHPPLLLPGSLYGKPAAFPHLLPPLPKQTLGPILRLRRRFWAAVHPMRQGSSWCKTPFFPKAIRRIFPIVLYCTCAKYKANLI